MPPQLQHPWNLAVQELETPLQLPFLAESGDPLVRLRAAAIVKEHWVYMFNLDESPATCDQDLLAMRKTMSRNTFADWVNACGYLQIVQNALTKGTYEDRTSGLWKQALVRRC